MFDLMLAPAVACLLIAGIHCYFGLHVVKRGVIFLDLAIAQIAVLGTVAALALGASEGWPTYAASFALVCVAAGVFASSHFHREGIPQEALIGITYAVAAAGTILFLDHNPRGHDILKQVMAGSVLYTTWLDVAAMAIVYGCVGLLHVVFRRRFFQISEDCERAERELKHMRWWDFLFYVTFGIVVVLSVQTAGVLLVFTYLVVPASAAMLFAKNMQARLLIGWGIGICMSAIGLALSVSFDLPTGAALVVVGGAVFALAVMVTRGR